MNINYHWRTITTTIHFVYDIGYHLLYSCRYYDMVSVYYPQRDRKVIESYCNAEIRLFQVTLPKNINAQNQYTCNREARSYRRSYFSYLLILSSRHLMVTYAVLGI